MLALVGVVPVTDHVTMPTVVGDLELPSLASLEVAVNVQLPLLLAPPEPLEPPTPAPPPVALVLVPPAAFVFDVFALVPPSPVPPLLVVPVFFVVVLAPPLPEPP